MMKWVWQSEASFNVLGPLFGLPFVTGSLPHSPQFVLSLAERDEDHQITHVRENRLAPLLCYFMSLCCNGQIFESWVHCESCVGFSLWTLVKISEAVNTETLQAFHLVTSPIDLEPTVMLLVARCKLLLSCNLFAHSGLVYHCLRHHFCNRYPKPLYLAPWFLWARLAFASAHFESCWKAPSTLVIFGLYFWVFLSTSSSSASSRLFPLSLCLPLRYRRHSKHPTLWTVLANVHWCPFCTKEVCICDRIAGDNTDFHTDSNRARCSLSSKGRFFFLLVLLMPCSNISVLKAMGNDLRMKHHSLQKGLLMTKCVLLILLHGCLYSLIPRWPAGWWIPTLDSIFLCSSWA